jgi:hypothetical protein
MKANLILGRIKKLMLELIHACLRKNEGREVGRVRKVNLYSRDLEAGQPLLSRNRIRRVTVLT